MNPGYTLAGKGRSPGGVCLSTLHISAFRTTIFEPYAFWFLSKNPFADNTGLQQRRV